MVKVHVAQVTILQKFFVVDLTGLILIKFSHQKVDFSVWNLHIWCGQAPQEILVGKEACALLV